MCGKLSITEVTSMKKTGALLPPLFAAFVLFSSVPAQPAKENCRAMERDEQQFGKSSPNAPPELFQFAFLIGKWCCEAKLKREDGTWEDLKATWEGRYILDGYAIADEYRMTTPAGELLVLGMNLRTYDSRKKAWNMKWLNALAGTWVDLGPEALGGVRTDETSISYRMKEPVARHTFTRTTYTNISENHFTWRGDRSNDGKLWEEFLIIEVYRRKN
jgi:hypothetical protein